MHIYVHNINKLTLRQLKKQHLHSLPGNSSGKVTSIIPQIILIKWKPNSLQLDSLRRKILDTCVRNWLAFLCWTTLAERFQQQTLKGQLTISDKLTHALKILLQYILGYQTNLWSFMNVEGFWTYIEIYNLKMSALPELFMHFKFQLHTFICGTSIKKKRQKL